MFKKIKYIIRNGYNPYPLYWLDLLTERKLKYRIGICNNCIECCKYASGGCCDYADTKLLKCKIYSSRKCDEWFPISKKELELMKIWKPGFTCKFEFIK